MEVSRSECAHQIIYFEVYFDLFEGLAKSYIDPAPSSCNHFSYLLGAGKLRLKILVVGIRWTRYAHHQENKQAHNVLGSY